MRYDVIVVGAGPGGSTAARECAERGLSVLLLDKAEFPRDKPCGGAVTIRAAELLPFSLTDVVERTLSGMHLTLRRSRGVSRHSSENLVYMTQRSRFDAFLVEQALNAGVELQERAAVRAVDRHASHVVVRTGDGSYEGSTLVAADGANGQTARMAGLELNLLHGIAFEGNITPTGRFPAEWEDSFGMDLGGVAGGYGWVFPKRDHLNIGIGGWKYVGPTLRALLDRLVRSYGFDPVDLWGLRGFHLPLRRSNTPLVDGNVLLVGDAAGLLDPLTGEGIFAAIWSGSAAAKHLSAFSAGEEPDLSGYREDVERELVPDLSVARQFQDLLHLAPGVYMMAEHLSSIAWGLTCRVLRGEQTYAGVMRDHPTLATIVGFVSDLVRVTPYLQRLAGLRDPEPPERFFLGGVQHQ